MADSEFTVLVAGPEHEGYAEHICKLIEEGAKARGTGIAKRSPEYIVKKMQEGKAIIALRDSDKQLGGFCYIESWTDGQYVANSGLIVDPQFRNQHLAKRIKTEAFELTRRRYPNAKLFGLTTSAAVMKINSDLGYRPVIYGELTEDEQFWDGCKTCVNYDVLTRNNRKRCLCTAMLADPNDPRFQQQMEKDKAAPASVVMPPYVSSRGATIISPETPKPPADSQP